MTKFFSLSLLALLCAACTDNQPDYDASGVFEATEVLVSAQGNGQILRFDVAEGQNVQADNVLGYIDTTQLHLRKKQLLASMKAADSRRYNVSQQIAAIKQQISTQHAELARFKKLAESDAATQKQVDDIAAQIALLERQLAAQTETLNNNNAALTSEAAVIEAQVQQIDDQIRQSLISSPISGTILSTYAEAGELAAAGKPLFKVADIRQMTLRVYITADQLTAVRLGQRVTVYADEGKAERRTYEGKVTWIADKAEFTPKTIQTRDERANLVYAVKVTVTNDGLIKKGMYGDLKLSEP